MEPIVVILFIALAAAGIFLRPMLRKQQKPSSVAKTPAADGHAEEDNLHEFPYALQKHFLSPTELNFFQNLRRVVGEQAVVCTKVSLGDVFRVKIEDPSKFRGYRNKIDRKHVDFLLCDSSTMRTLVGIELDDSSHQRPDRVARDEFVDGVFAAAGLPLLHIPARQSYSPDGIAAALAPYLATPSAPSTSSPIEPSAKQPTTASPKCPNCECEMVLRTIKQGPRAGTKFWGCVNYPNCRGMLPISAVVDEKRTTNVSP